MTRALAPTLIAALGAIAVLAGEDRELVQRDVYLMGTRALLATYAPDRDAGLRTLETAVDVLEHTEAELSTWRPDSALSRLNARAVGEAWHADGELCRLFEELYRWQRETDGAFDPAVGALASAWRIHDGGRVPDATQLAGARERSGLALLDFDRQACSARRRADVSLDAGAFGKGEALDRVARTLAGHTWLIDLGGQVAVGGALPGGHPWVVDIAHPLDRDRVVMQVELRSGSLSTSGGSERDVYVNGTRVGHILDPRSGMPASFTGAVVVWHERALVADILSTALYVMGPEAGLRWAEANGVTAGYLMAGRYGVSTATTSGFTGRLKPTVRE